MNTQQFLQYINQPASLDQHATRELEQLVAEYPAFHAAQVLLARAYKNLHDHRFEQQLKKAAIHTGDRALLFDYLQEDPVRLETPSMPVQPAVKETPAIPEPEPVPPTIEDPIAKDPMVTLEGDHLIEASTHINLEELSAPETAAPADMPVINRVYTPLPDETPEFILTSLDDETDGFERPTFVNETTTPAIDTPEIPEQEIMDTDNTFSEHDERPTYVEPEDAITEDAALTDIPETGLPPVVEMPGQSPFELPAETEPEEEPEEEPNEQPEEPGEEQDPMQPSHFGHTEQEEEPVTEPVVIEEVTTARLPIVDFPETHIPAEEAHITPEPQDIPETKEEIVAENTGGSHDFSWWLDHLKSEPSNTLSRQEEEKEQKEETLNSGITPTAEDHDKSEKKKSTLNIIDRFLEEQPSISKPQAEFFKPANMARQSEQFDPDWVTETLAKVYARQGNIQKAIDIYQKLILQFPDKKSYFASRIAELKNKN